ncbi:uncharacterized protein LOC118432997 [Folsomia candida]|uniref:Uncharacterized protein n=1 Tax=Folsomia candida TaxID=158441 RepID=A0A226D5D4_FOLCA|nr:uncharacterized protein LOC118432997 [Folsomia candida]OXA39446.1 hypothetical protein Fcan01_25611 [Folsomia candida]
MDFYLYGLDTFLTTFVEEEEGGLVLISQIKTALSNPDKFYDAFSPEDGIGSLKSGLHYLIKFVQTRADTFVMFRMTNYLLLITTKIGADVESETQKLSLDWKEKVGQFGHDDRINIASKSIQVEEEIREDLILDLLKSAKFPEETASWTIALPFLQRIKSIPSDPKFLSETSAVLLEKEKTWKEYGEEEKTVLLKIFRYTLVSQNNVDSVTKFLLQVLQNEEKAEPIEKHEIVLLISKTLELKIFTVKTPLPVECIQFMSNLQQVDSSTSVLSQLPIYQYCLDILNNSTDPIYIASTSSLFLHPPESNPDADQTSIIFSIFIKSQFPYDNSVYANLLKVLDIKGTDGKLAITKEILSSLITIIEKDLDTPSDKRALSSEQTNNCLKVLTTCGKNSANFSQNPPELVALVGDFCINFFNKSTNNGKSLPEKDFSTDFMLMLKNYVLIGYPLSVDTFKGLYNLLTFPDFPRSEEEGEGLIQFLSAALDKFKFPKDTVDWDVAITSDAIDSKGIFLSSIGRNIDLDIQVGASLLLSVASDNLNVVMAVTGLQGAWLITGVIGREILSKYNQNILDKKAKTIGDQRKNVIMSLLFKKEYFPFSGELLLYIFYSKEELNGKDLTYITMYFRDIKGIALFDTIKEIFTRIKDKGEAYVSGYADLFDLHATLIDRFKDTIKDNESTWAGWWSEYVLNGLEISGDDKVDESRVELAIKLLFIIPYKGESKTELNIDKWDHIKELLDKFLNSGDIRDDIKGDIRKVYDRIGVK